MWYASRSHTFEILNVENLPFPILLGKDAPGFGSLVQTALQEVTAAVEEQLNGGEEPSSNQGPEPNPPDWTTDPYFLQAQKDDVTQERLWDDRAVIEGTPIDQSRASQYPHIEICHGLLWHIKATARPGEAEELRMVIPKEYHAQVLQQVHGHPWAGHQGRA